MQILKLLLALGLVVMGFWLLLPHAMVLVEGRDTPTSPNDQTLSIIGACMASVGIWWTLSIFFGGPAKNPENEDSLEFRLAIDELQKNYQSLRTQTNLAFAVSAGCVVVGTSVILLGALMLLGVFGDSEIGNGMITTLTGVVVEVVSGIGMYLYNLTFKRMNDVSDRLQSNLKLQMLFDQAEQIPNETERTRTVQALIVKVAGLKKRERAKQLAR